MLKCRAEHKQLRQLLDDMSTLEDQAPDNQLKEDFYSILEEAKEHSTELDHLYIASKTFLI